MKKTLFLFIFISSLYSCLNMNDPKEHAQYIKLYKSFEIEMINHFPKKLPNNQFATGFSSPTYLSKFYNYSHIYLKTKTTSKEKFERQKKILIKEAKIITKSTDDCVLIIASKEKQKISDCNELIPVPEYLMSEFTNKKKKVSNNEIAVLDYKSGVFLNSEKLNKKENFPEKWKNGYSKGYAFDNDEQTITYWLIIW